MKFKGKIVVIIGGIVGIGFGIVEVYFCEGVLVFLMV